MTNNKTALVAFIALSLTLSACASSGNRADVSSPRTTTSGKIDKAITSALAEAEANGNKQEILAVLEQAHAREPKNATLAVKYAKALRKDDQINAARRVLSPYVKGNNPNIDALTEMALAELALGNYTKAEEVSAYAIEQSPKNGRAYMALGTAQDALGKHEDAEISFREGLKYSKGDSAPLLNNLALNLASQGHLKESLAVLTKAREAYPKRMDIERNYRIISTLQEDSGPLAPPPSAKPKIKPKAITPTNTAKKPEPKKSNDLKAAAKSVNEEVKKATEKPKKKKPIATYSSNNND